MSIVLILDEGTSHERREPVPLELFCAALFESLPVEMKSQVVGVVLGAIDRGYDPDADLPIPVRTRRTTPQGPPSGARLHDELADAFGAHHAGCAMLDRRGPCDCPQVTVARRLPS